MQRDSSVSEQFTRTVGTFAALGPLIGAGVVVVMLAAAALASDLGGALSIPSAAAFVLIAITVGYIAGVIPATVAGIACHFFARTIQADLWWVTASAAVGGGITAMIGAFLGLGPGSSVDTLSVAMTSSLPGAVAAAVCAFRLRKARWT